MFARIRRMAGIAAIILVASTFAAAPASAGPTVSFVPPGGWRPVIVSDTGWTPVPDANLEIHAVCGTLVYASRDPKTINERVTRTVTFRNGDTLTTAKGTEYVLFNDTNAPNDTVNGVDVTVPISGTVTRLRLASGATTVNKQGSGLLLTSNFPGIDLTAAEAAAFQRSHIQNFSVFSSGSLTEQTNAQGTYAMVITKPARTKSVCDLMGLGQFKDIGAFSEGVDSFGL